MISPNTPDGAGNRTVRISLPITVRRFAELTELKAFRVISDLMELGVFASMNQVMSESTVRVVGKKNGIDVEIVTSRAGRK